MPKNLDSLDEMGKFLQIPNLSKLSHEKKEDFNVLIRSN